MKVAQQGSGQSGVVGRFLLGLYSSYDYPFALVELRRLDHDLFEDCLRVLQLDNQPVYELHDYLQDGSVIFAKLFTINIDKLYPPTYIVEARIVTGLLCSTSR